MSKHMPEEQRYEYLLKTLVSSEELRVTSIDDSGIIHFNASEECRKNLIRLLADEGLMAEQITHAIPANKIEQKVEVDNAQNAEDQLMADFMQLSGSQVISKLFSSAFLQQHKINPDDFVERSEGHKLAGFKIESANRLIQKRDLLGFEFLQSALNNLETLTKIAKGELTPLSCEALDGSVTDFGKGIMSIETQGDKNATVVFNYGFLLQQMQHQHKLALDLPPVIATSSIDDAGKMCNCSISKNQLLRHVGRVGNGLVLKTEADNQLRPIAVNPMNDGVVLNEAHHVHFLIDCSGSMKENFSEFKPKAIEIIRKIKQDVPNTMLRITSFNNNTPDAEKTFALETTLDAAVHFIDHLQARGSTALNFALIDALKAAQPNSTLILFSDGYNTATAKVVGATGTRILANGEPDLSGGEITYQATQEELDNQVIALAIAKRQADPQFSMFSMGYGKDYSRNFFSTIAKQAGFTHMDLDTFDRMNEFKQYVAGLGRAKVIYDFVLESAKFYLQCPAGDVAISDTTIPQGTDIRRGGEVLNIGTVARLSKDEIDMNKPVSSTLAIVLPTSRMWSDLRRTTDYHYASEAQAESLSAVHDNLVASSSSTVAVQNPKAQSWGSYIAAQKKKITECSIQ